MRVQKSKTILRIVSISIIICAIFGGFIIYHSVTALRSNISTEIENRANDVSRLVEKQMEIYIGQVENIASRAEIKSMNWQRQRKILITEAERIGFERFQVGYIDNTKEHIFGDVISTTGETSNAADRAFFKKAAVGKANISDVLFARIDHKMVLCISAPIYRDGEIVGILTGVTDASILSKFVNSMGFDKQGYAFIINRDGTKMSAVDYTEVKNAQNDILLSEGKKGPDKESTIAPDERYDQLANIEKKMIRGKSGSETYEYDGKEFFIGYTPLMDGQWSLAVIESAGEAMNHSYTLITWIVIMAIVIAAIFLFRLHNYEERTVVEDDFSGMLETVESEDIFSPDSEDTESINELLNQLNDTLSVLSEVCEETREVIADAEQMQESPWMKDRLHHASMSVDIQRGKMEEARDSLTVLRNKISVFFRI